MSEPVVVPMVCVACRGRNMVIHLLSPRSITSLSGIVEYHCAKCGRQGLILPTPPAHRDEPPEPATEKLTACRECYWYCHHDGHNMCFCPEAPDATLFFPVYAKKFCYCHEWNTDGHCPGFKTE